MPLAVEIALQMLVALFSCGAKCCTSMPKVEEPKYIKEHIKINQDGRQIRIDITVPVKEEESAFEIEKS